MNKRGNAFYTIGSLTKKGKGRAKDLVETVKQLLTSKRQKFILAVIILSLGLFFSEHIRIDRYGIIVALLLSFFTDIFLLWANFRDISENFSLSIFILPFFYSLSFGLFYFLIPTRLFTSIVMTSLYAGGLYSLFLSQNIFIVASIRTIALLSSARTVSFIITLIAYFFLSNTTFSLHAPIFLESLIILIFSFFLTSHAIWIHTLDRNFFANIFWVLSLSFCLFAIVLVLWFWPSSPTVLALFLTGFFYAIVGLSHVWFDKRLFRGVIWEYLWVSVIVSLILLLSTFSRI